MANPHPKHKFKKGVSPNPKGRPPMNELDRQVRKLTKERLNEIISKILTSTPEEIQRIKEDKATDALTAWILSGAAKGIKTGDMDQLEKVLLNRVLGKVKEQVEVSGEGLRPVILKFQDNGRQVKPN